MGYAMITSQKKLPRQSALHIIYDMDVAANWEHLNASRATVEATRWQLLQGVPATETSLGIQKVTDVCIVQQAGSVFENTWYGC